MIYDKLSNIKLYKGISKNLDKAIDFLLKNDISKFPIGKFEIDNDIVFGNIMDAITKPQEELKFEAHRKYIDIQLDISGSETVAFAYDELISITDYDSEKDIIFYRAINDVYCPLGPDKFVICFPHDAHKPGILTPGESNHVRKCVIKVMF